MRKVFDMKIKNCEVCGNELSKCTSKGTPLSPKRYEQLSYCSYSCARKSSYVVPEKKHCIECDSEISLNFPGGRTVHKKLYEKRLFCGSDCQLTYRNRNRKTKREYPKGWWGKKHREYARKLTDFVCAICKVKEELLGERLSIHHIDYDKKNLDSGNLLPLCRPCHTKTNGNRDYWFVVCSDLMRKYERAAEMTAPHSIQTV